MDIKSISTQASNQDFSWGVGEGGEGGATPQVPGPQINNVRMIGYESSEDTTSD